MAWTTPRTWADGEVVTAALLNAQIRDNLDEVSPEALSATYARKRAVDPRAYDLTGGADDSTPMQAALDAAGVSGTLYLPDDLQINLQSTLTLPVGLTMEGSGAKGSTLATDLDITMLAMESNEGAAIRNMRLVNSATARTTYDIDVVNGTKPVIENVEISLPGASTGAGGVRFRRDALLPGNSFMPQIRGLWVRNGHMVVDSCTDGHMENSWIWGHDAGGNGAIELLNLANGWTFTGIDVVPGVGGGAGYYIDGTYHTSVLGGYIDGSYAEILTGYGVKINGGGRLTFSGVRFWNVGRSGAHLTNTTGNIFEGCVFSKNNKQDSSYPDIDLYGSSRNVFLGNSHWAPDARVNKGLLYREDATSLDNNLDHVTIDTTTGNNYDTAMVSANPGTLGQSVKPASLFPVITPPSATFGIPTPTAWPAGNAAIGHRFTLARGGTYRYACLRVESGSGNMQACVVKLSGTTSANYTRVMDSGVVACTAGDKIIDMGSTYLEPGNYALMVWLDNSTATLYHGQSNGIPASRMSAVPTGLVGGVPASGTLTWNGSRYVGGLSLALAV